MINTNLEESCLVTNNNDDDEKNLTPLQKLAKIIKRRGGTHCLTISLIKIRNNKRSIRATKNDSGIIESISIKLLCNIDRYIRRLCARKNVPYNNFHAIGFLETKTKKRSVEIYPHIHFIINLPPFIGLDKLRLHIYINKEIRRLEKNFSVELDPLIEPIRDIDDWSNYIIKHTLDEDSELSIIVYPSGNSV